MFAVPGWSVSSAVLAPQTEPKPQPNGDASQQSHDASHYDAQSKKRKRRSDHVTASNVDEMYRRVIEGKTGKRQASKKSKKNKGAGGGSRENANAVQPIAGGELPAPPENETQKNKKQKTEQKKKKKEDRQSDHTQERTENGKAAASTEPLLPPAPPTTSAILTPLQQAMRQKLISARFRHLNETLYTTPSTKALELFTANPELFGEYHAGFSRQVRESWPSNPVDGYIQAIRTRATVSPNPRKFKPNGPATGAGAAAAAARRPLPRRPNGLCTIVDLGCGDAQLARILTPSVKRLNLKLLSYDLHAPDPLITKADISNLPLEDGSADLAIFCLSLMGTNWVSFVEEAWRILRSDGKGECWVSEVKSRFGKVTRKKAQIGLKKHQQQPQPLSNAEKKKLKKQKKNKAGHDEDDSDIDDADIYAEDAAAAASTTSGAGSDDETDISAFVEVFRTRGFILKPESVDKSNKMFVKMEFVKQGGPPTKGKYAASVVGGQARGVRGGGGVGAGVKKRFIDRVTDAEKNALSSEEEAKVLKPCLYKIR